MKFGCVVPTVFCPADLPEFRWPFGLRASEERVGVLQSTAEGYLTDFTVRAVAVHVSLVVWQHFGHGFTDSLLLRESRGKNGLGGWILVLNLDKVQLTLLLTSRCLTERCNGERSDASDRAPDELV